MRSRSPCGLLICLLSLSSSLPLWAQVTPETWIRPVTRSLDQMSIEVSSGQAAASTFLRIGEVESWIVTEETDWVSPLQMPGVAAISDGKDIFAPWGLGTPPPSAMGEDRTQEIEFSPSRTALGWPGEAVEAARLFNGAASDTFLVYQNSLLGLLPVEQLTDHLQCDPMSNVDNMIWTETQVYPIWFFLEDSVAIGISGGDWRGSTLLRSDGPNHVVKDPLSDNLSLHPSDQVVAFAYNRNDGCMVFCFDANSPTLSTIPQICPGPGNMFGYVEMGAPIANQYPDLGSVGITCGQVYEWARSVQVGMLCSDVFGGMRITDPVRRPGSDGTAWQGIAGSGGTGTTTGPGGNDSADHSQILYIDGSGNLLDGGRPRRIWVPAMTPIPIQLRDSHPQTSGEPTQYALSWFTGTPLPIQAVSTPDSEWTFDPLGVGAVWIASSWPGFSLNDTGFLPLSFTIPGQNSGFSFTLQMAMWRSGSWSSSNSLTIIFE